MGRPLKDGKITLTEEEKNILTKIRKSKTETAIRVKRATMLLLSDEGKTLVDIASKLDFHFSAVKLCLTKYRKGGIEGALNDEKGRGRKAVITDEDKVWIKNIACKKPVDFGYAQELWSIRKLREHIINNCSNMLFSKFFEFRVSILPLLLFFLLLNIACKMNLAFEIGLFIAGIIIIRSLCYGTFIFDYKEVSMGILFGRYSQIVNKILILALVAAVVIIISKYKIGMACKKNYFISIIFSLCAGLILYSIRPSVFNLVIQHQNYGSEIYMFNSLYFYYYFILFLTAILIPVNFISRMIYLEIKYQ